MAYSGANLSKVTHGGIANLDTTIPASTIFAYYSAADSVATVLVTDYISDGHIRVMKIGDVVFANLNGTVYNLQVLGLQAVASGNGVSLGWLNSGATNNVPPAKYSTAALQAAAIPAANMSGGDFVVFDNTGTTPATLTTDTAANIIAANPGWQVGQSYMLRIRNDSGSANTATIAGGTGVTVTGTATIAQYVARDFVVTYTGASAVTLQNVGDSAAAS